MKLTFYIILLFTTSLFAQKVSTTIDSTKKKIGAEFKVTLKTEVDTAVKVKFPSSKSFGLLEVIESYKIDTIEKGSKHELIKKYGLTQFDSGKYVIPKIPVLINGKTIFSDSITIEVQNVAVDTLKQKMYDIRDIIPVETSSSWWLYIVLILAVIAIGLGVYFLIYKRKKQVKPEGIVFKTPIEKATTLLQSLESKELWQKGEVKSYYSELTDIARNYIEEEIRIPAMESTTSELIEGLRNASKQKKLKLSNETVENLERVLKQADLVKFAKVKPLDFEIEEDKKRISNSIVTIHKSIPEVVEENDELAIWNEQQKEKARLAKLKKQKQAKMLTTVGIVLGVLIIGLLSLIYFKGFDYVKDKVMGNPTKELLEGEWIYSEYGNPGIKIETPKVLKRQEAEKIMPKNAMALIKEMQIFANGSSIDHFYIGISTSSFKKETPLDLQQVAEESIKIFETQGAQNIIVKTEDFDTQNGITGKKVYGTMVVLNKIKGSSNKMYYEILIFTQKNGIQQITVMHPEGDGYGQKIMERVLNSVELQNNSQ
jgi:hypothetical protein